MVRFTSGVQSNTIRFLGKTGFFGLPEVPGSTAFWDRALFRVGVPVALADDLLVDQQVIALPEDVGQQSAVAVPAGRHGLDLQTDPERREPSASAGTAACRRYTLSSPCGGRFPRTSPIISSKSREHPPGVTRL